MRDRDEGPSPEQVRFVWGAIKWAVFGVFVLAVGWGSFFVVEPTQMAGVRRLGTVQYTEPVLPGFHLKAPFIDSVDTLQVSIDNFKINDLHVYTIDNQSVTIAVGITYRIPSGAVMKLLYQVGKPGDAGIMRNVEQIIADRTLKVFAKHNTIKISEEREAIAGEVRLSVSQAIRDQFGVEILDLQIPAIRYSDIFVASVEAAVKAKNDAIAAENTVNRMRYEGEQTVVTAKAQAEATVAKAGAAKQAAILEAEGEAQAIKIKGDSLRDNPRVIELTLAQRWSGMPPQTILGGNNNAVPFFNIAAGTAAR